MDENAPEGTPGVDGVDLFTRPYDWPPGEAGVGQCMGCGFLSRRSTDLSRPGAEEVTVEARKMGQLFRMHHGGPAIPWCFIRPSSEVDLWRETQAKADEERREAHAAGTPDSVQVSLSEIDVMAPLTKDRKCPEWWPYRQFLSPHEHRAERDMMRLEADRRALDQRLADMDRDTQLRLAALSNQAEEIAERRERFTFWAFLIVGLVGVALGLVAVAATLYPDEVRALIAAWIAELNR